MRATNNLMMSPRPRLYLFLALLCTCHFALLAILLEPGVLIALHSHLVGALHQWAVDHPRVLGFFTFVTDLGAGRPLYWAGTLSVFALAWRREWFRAVVWLAAMLGSRPVAPWFKGQFERVRPPFIDWTDFSFPSGHAFGSAVTYGMLALVVLRVGRGSRWRWVLDGAIYAFIGLVVVSVPFF